MKASLYTSRLQNYITLRCTRVSEKKAKNMSCIEKLGRPISLVLGLFGQFGQISMGRYMQAALQNVGRSKKKNEKLQVPASREAARARAAARPRWRGIVSDSGEKI
jgi:hypothetical protein